MITAFMSANEWHVVQVIHQKGITKIKARGLCTIEDDAGAGVYQVPDWAFDGRSKFFEIGVCQKCAASVASMKEPPPSPQPFR